MRLQFHPVLPGLFAPSTHVFHQIFRFQTFRWRLEPEPQVDRHPLDEHRQFLFIHDESLPLRPDFFFGLSGFMAPEPYPLR